VSEVPHNQSQEEPGVTGHEQRIDRLAETIEKIHGCFEQLVTTASSTVYTRQQEIRLNADFATQIEPITVRTDAYGGAQGSGNLSIHASLPSLLNNSADINRPQHGSHIIVRKVDSGVRALFTPNTQTPRDLLQLLLQKDDLPDSLTHIVQEVASALIRERQYDNADFDGIVAITDEQFARMWDDVQNAMGTTPTEVLWSQGFADNDRISMLATVNTHLPLDKDHPVERAELVTGMYRYTTRVDDAGNRMHVFEQNIADEDLSDLTDEQRAENPYMVVPIDALQQSESGEGIIMIDMKGGDMTFSQPMNGYAVINPQSVERNIDKVIDNYDDAQRYARILYGRDIARSHASTELTYERALTVLATLHELMTRPEIQET